MLSGIRERIAAVPLVRKAHSHLVKWTVRSGVISLCRAVTGRRHVILTFHRIRPADQPVDPFDTCPSMSVDTFRRMMNYVKGRFDVVPLQELCTGYAGKKAAAAVTFDDGWRDNYDLAFPVLQELGIPATIFVTTGRIGSSQLFWQQTLGQAIRGAIACPDGQAARGLRVVLQLRNGRPMTPKLYRATVIRWKNLTSAQREDYLFRAGCTAPASTEHPRCFLSVDEIREMAAAGIAFGSHTVTHPLLPQEPRSVIERELAESKASLEGLLGGPIDMLAYPDGRYSQEVVACARAIGYKIGCTTRVRGFSGKDDLLRLPRLEAPWDSSDDLYTCDVAPPGDKLDAAATIRRIGAKKIKILFLIDEFCGPEGGTEQHLLFLQRELPRDMFELYFGVLTAIRRMEPGEFPVRPVMLGEGTRRGPAGALHRLRRLVRLIKAVDADVVHAFCRRSELDALLATKWAGRGKVLGIRRNIGYWHNWFTRWTARLAGTLGADYAANCEATRDFAARVEWIPRRRVCVIRNPAPSKRLEEGLAAVPAPSSLGIVDGEQVVGMVAVVKPVKDYATFLHSARLVLDIHPRTRFLVVGVQEPDYTLQMRQLANDLGIDGQVSWVGPMPNPLSVLPLFDVAVLSSQSEAFSNSVLEYAAAGVATVATDVGGTREIIDDGVTGFIVPPQSPEVLGERIGRLLSDRDLRSALGENARRKAQTVFSEERILSEYGRMYSQLVGPNGSHQL